MFETGMVRLIDELLTAPTLSTRQDPQVPEQGPGGGGPAHPVHHPFQGPYRR